jgi:hypothetical protein
VDNELKTYGDLKKVIKFISKKQRDEKISDVGIDFLLGFVPGFDVARTTFDFFKAIITKPDEKKNKYLVRPFRCR